MKLNPSEFISKAESLKSSEINVRQHLESIRSQRASIQSKISTLEYRLDSLYMELEFLQDDEDEETDNSAAIASVRSEISSTHEEIREYESQDAELSIEESETEEELRRIELEEQDTLADIQDSASRTNQNIALISSFGGDYANVSAQATGSLQQNMSRLSQAAQILGGSVAMGAIGGGGGRSTSSASPSPALSNERNFYEAANNQRNNGTTHAGSFGAKGAGASSTSRKEKDSYGAIGIDEEEEKPKKTGGFGRKPINHSKSPKAQSGSNTNGVTQSVALGTATIVSAITAKQGSSLPENTEQASSSSAKPHTFRDYLNPVNYDSDGHYTGDYRTPVIQTAQAVADYNSWNNNGGIGLPSTDLRKNGGVIETIVPAQNIFDVYDSENPNFWNYKSRPQSDYIAMATYIPLVRKHLDSGKSLSEIERMGGIIGACATNYFRNPVKVMKAGDAYIHCNDGRHRTVAAQIAKVELPVCIVQDFSVTDKKTVKLNAGTGTFRSLTKNLAKSNASNTDSNGDYINVDLRNTWDYGHTTGFEKRHLESFGYLIGLSQKDLSDLMNSTIMVEIQNRSRNRDHSAEEKIFSEAMRWILMSNWDHLPLSTQKKFSIDGDDIIFHDNGMDIILTPTSIDELIDNEIVRNAFIFDASHNN